MTAPAQVPILQSVGAAPRFVMSQWRSVATFAAFGALATAALAAIAVGTPFLGIVISILTSGVQAAVYTLFIAGFLSLGTGGWLQRALTVWGAMIVIAFFLFIVLFVISFPATIVLFAGPLGAYTADLQAAGTNQDEVMKVMVRFVEEQPGAIALTLLFFGAVWMYLTSRLYLAAPATAEQLNLSTGVIMGFGLAGCSFPMVVGALGKLVPESWRSFAFGAGTAAGSFGQFLYSPLAHALIDAFSWQTALLVFAGIMLLVLPLSLMLATPPAAPLAAGAPKPQSYKQALSEAFAHRSYVLLVLGFFTCGFQLAFVTFHLPSYLVDRGLSADVGAWTIGLIGLFNIVGSLSSGWLASRMPKRYILSFIYFGRAIAVVAFITLPASTASTLIFGAVTGLLWLSTVPPTSGLVALMFGTRWLTMLFGFAFFSHQVGGFLGAWLGGVAFEYTGSYNVVWWLSVFFGVASAIINLPIVEKPVVRPAGAPA
jgi:predicted MFS family arabinose efflux permease